jgi:ssDNA-binding Zn-finger/Zn-ribbon topoisomerase 1
MSYWLKGCPKCRGDLREESDKFGAYFACVQCGYILKAEEEALIVARRPAGAAKERLAA